MSERAAAELLARRAEQLRRGGIRERDVAGAIEHQQRAVHVLHHVARGAIERLLRGRCGARALRSRENTLGCGRERGCELRCIHALCRAAAKGCDRLRIAAHDRERGRRRALAQACQPLECTGDAQLHHNQRAATRNEGGARSRDVVAQLDRNARTEREQRLCGRAARLVRRGRQRQQQHAPEFVRFSTHAVP